MVGIFTVWTQFPILYSLFIVQRFIPTWIKTQNIKAAKLLLKFPVFRRQKMLIWYT